MASRSFYISGICKWAKLFKPDTKFEPQYSLILYPDADGWVVWKETGLGGKIKEDEDGKFVTLRRKIAGPEWQPVLPPPEVVDAEGKPLDKLVGNGSAVTVKIEVYDTRKGPGHRIEKVRVDKLVEYVAQSEEDAPEAKPAGTKPKGLPF
jgi:hypothetical protein